MDASRIGAGWIVTCIIGGLALVVTGWYAGIGPLIALGLIATGIGVGGVVIDLRAWWRNRSVPVVVAPPAPRDAKTVTRELVDLVREGRWLAGQVANTILEKWVADLSIWTHEIDDWCSRCRRLVEAERPRFTLELEAAITKDVSAHHQWDTRAPIEALRNAFAIDAHGERTARIRSVLVVMEKIVAAE